MTIIDQQVLGIVDDPEIRDDEEGHSVIVRATRDDQLKVFIDRRELILDPERTVREVVYLLSKAVAPGGPGRRFLSMSAGHSREFFETFGDPEQAMLDALPALDDEPALEVDACSTRCTTPTTTATGRRLSDDRDRHTDHDPPYSLRVRERPTARSGGPHHRRRRGRHRRVQPERHDGQVLAALGPALTMITNASCVQREERQA